VEASREVRRQLRRRGAFSMSGAILILNRIPPEVAAVEPRWMWGILRPEGRRFYPPAVIGQDFPRPSAEE